MWDYSEKVKDHFFSPRNARAVEQANAIGDVGSISCGDALRLTLKVNPDNEVIEDAGFQTFGCGSAIASSSALTEMVVGKTLDEASQITNQHIADYLDGLPPEKMHCSVMGTEALQAAIANYRGEKLEDDHEEGELICKCFAIDDEMIKRVVKHNGLTELREVIHYTKAGGACEACHEKIEWLLDDILASEKPAVKKAPVEAAVAEESKPTYKKRKKPLNMVQKIRIIEKTLAELRPGIQADGGDIRLTDIEDDMVFVALTGACSGCGLAGTTLAMVEEKLCEALRETVSVFPVGALAMQGGAA